MELFIPGDANCGDRDAIPHCLNQQTKNFHTGYTGQFCTAIRIRALFC